MKGLASFTLAMLGLLGISGANAPDLQVQTAINYDWHKFGRSLRNAKVRPDTATAKKIVTEVANKMSQLQVTVNNGWGGRLSSKAQYGRQDVGRCGWINDAVQDALLGAGFQREQIFGVVCIARGTEDAGSASALQTALASGFWLNIDHVAPAIVINDKVIVFDLWRHALDAGSYNGFGTSPWNGRSVNSWGPAMQHYPYFRFVRMGNLPAPQQTGPVLPGQIEKDIVEDFYRQRFPQPTSAAPKTPIGKKKITGPRWTRIEIRNTGKIREVSPRDPNRYNQITTEGGEGSMEVTAEWNDPNGLVHSCSASATWTISTDMVDLKPGEQFSVKGEVRFGGQVMRGGVYVPNDGTIFGFHWHLPGFPAHVTHSSAVKQFAKNVFTNGDSFSNVPLTVPPKSAFPEGKMVLRFLLTARGYGAVEYVYKWVNG